MKTIYCSPRLESHYTKSCKAVISSGGWSVQALISGIPGIILNGLQKSVGPDPKEQGEEKTSSPFYGKRPSKY